MFSPKDVKPSEDASMNPDPTTLPLKDLPI